MIHRAVEKLHGFRAVDLSRSAMGEWLGGIVYGTIIVLAVVVAGAKAYPNEAGQIAALVAVTSVVFWLAHVYANGIAQSIAKDERISLAELRHVARREASIVEAALPSVAVLLLGAFGLVSTEAAVWTAFGLGLTVLAVEGIVLARVEHLGRLGTLAVVSTNLALGAALVGFKLLLIH